MRKKIIRKGNKYKWRYSLDVDDWLVLAIVVFIANLVMINLIMRG